MCDAFYHGAYCDIDERDPLLIGDIEGGGSCDTADGNECKCYTVRTANPVIESFQCKIKAYAVSSVSSLCHPK